MSSESIDQLSLSFQFQKERDEKSNKQTLDLLSPLLVTLMVCFLYAKENLQGTQKHHSTMMCHAQFCFGEDGRVSM
ncbi:unnamed protein product [Prunus armeniaca]